MITKDILYITSCKVMTLTADMVSEDYVRWINDKEVNRYLVVRHEPKQTIESLKQYVKKSVDSDNSLLLAIVDVNSGSHIGNIHLQYNWNEKNCSIGYVLGEKNMWGRGLMTQCIKEITSWAFENYDIDKIYIAYYLENIGSGKVVKKCGYRIEGTLRSHVLLESGNRTDLIMAGMLRQEYESIKRALD